MWTLINQKAEKHRASTMVRSPPDEFDPEKDEFDEFDDEPGQAHKPESEQQLLSDDDKYVMECLCRFLRKNKNLVHVDLSHTNLSEKALWYFGKTMRRAKSLRALHLTGNPGITDRVVDYLQRRAHCIHIKEQNFIDFS